MNWRTACAFGLIVRRAVLDNGLKRCDWCTGSDLYVSYHDEEWGVPLHDSHKLFEFLLLEGAQAGLSWITVLKKRDNYRVAFDGFNPAKIALYGEEKEAELMQNSGIIRNRLKIRSAINNAQRFMDMPEPFSDYIWQFVEGQSIVNDYKSQTEVPATNEVSDRMSKSLKKLGFNFVGSTICYAFMQATGMVNDHLTHCHRHQQC